MKRASWSTIGRMRSLGASLATRLVLAGALAGCGSTPISTPAPGSNEIPAPGPTAPAATGLESATPLPSVDGFAFDAESILGYYASLGYACDPGVPSTQAVDHTVRSCRLVDPDGRTRVVTVVTDANDTVADAFTSLAGAEGEPILDPTASLDPFAAFLGATLGESQGESLLPWLAGHIGDVDATTTVGELTVATYSESPVDHSRLYLEIASQAFLDAPRPSLSG